MSTLEATLSPPLLLTELKFNGNEKGNEPEFSFYHFFADECGVACTPSGPLTQLSLIYIIRILFTARNNLKL
jgi:hypothetical protein